MNIGSRITELRKAKNWSQTQLAQHIGVSRVIIGRYERNEAIPSLEVAKKMVDAFGVSLDSLVGEGKHSKFDQKILNLMDDIQSLDPGVQDKLFFLLKAIIRDTKTQLNYS